MLFAAQDATEKGAIVNSGLTAGDGKRAPSLESRLGNIETWVRCLMKYAPITALSVEHVKFDTRKLQNPEVSGVECQHGELLGCEVKQYLLEKRGYECASCPAADVPWEAGTSYPKAGPSLRINGRACDLEKGDRTAGDFECPITYKSKPNNLGTQQRSMRHVGNYDVA